MTTALVPTVTALLWQERQAFFAFKVAHQVTNTAAWVAQQVFASEEARRAWCSPFHGLLATLRHLLGQGCVLSCSAHVEGLASEVATNSCALTRWAVYSDLECCDSHQLTSAVALQPCSTWQP